MAYTSFFRDADVLDAIGSKVVPWVASQPEIKVWDAGCATGEEAYSLAMIFAERLDPFTIRNVRILATDHEESRFLQFGEKISQGRYNRQDIQWVPEGLRRSYFMTTENAELFEVIPALKGCVHYTKHDLLSLDPVDSGFALVVCKNVLMHFKPEERPAVVEMFHRVLRPGGFLAFDSFQDLPEENAHQFEQVEPGLHLFRKIEVDG